MNIHNTREFVKDFFEKYYVKLKSDDLLKEIRVPDEMLVDGANSEKSWNSWKLILSTITDEDIKKLEISYKVKFPIVLKVFLSTYHHLFREPVGCNSIIKPFAGFSHAYSPQLTENNFLPFVWDKDNYFIRCIDLTNMPYEQNCPVMQIDHEHFFQMQYDANEKGEIIPREQLVKYMQPVSDNFFEYLNAVYDGLDDEV